MKRNSILLIMLVFAFIFAGCAPTPSPTSVPAAPTATTAAAAATATTAAPTATTAATAGPAVEIQFWHGQSQSQQEALNGLVDQFNQTHPGIHVTATYQGNYSDLYTKITAAIAGNAPPDLAIGYQNDISNYVNSDAVIPLDDLIADPQIGFSQADLQDIFPAFIDHYPQFGGKVYSMAFMRSMEVMYYNVDMLKAAGFDNPPENWDDFLAACAAVNNPPEVTAVETTGDASHFASWVFGRGGDLINSDGTAVAFDSQAGLDTLTFFGELFQKGYAILPSVAFGDQTDFALGKVCFTFGSTAGLPYYKSAIDDAGVVKNWAIATEPHTTPQPVVDVYGPSVTIFKTTTEKERAAFTFLTWLMSPEPDATWIRATAYFPARASTVALLSDYAQANPLYGMALNWLQYGRTEPTIAAWNPIRGFINDAMTAVANGIQTPQQALDEAVQKSNAAIAGQ